LTTTTDIQTPDTRNAVQRHVGPNLGFLVAVLALPFAILIHAPVAGWALAVGMLTLNRAANWLVLQMVEGAPQTMAVAGAGLGMIMRVWTIAFVLFLTAADLNVGGVHLGADRRDIAVPAMILFMIFFTVDVAARSLSEVRRYRSADTATPSTEDVA
jgi:hypothetical protein